MKWLGMVGGDTHSGMRERLGGCRYFAGRGMLGRAG